MNHTAILQRAFEITRRYPLLWVFGFLVALSSGGGGGGGGGNAGISTDEPPRLDGLPDGSGFGADLGREIEALAGDPMPLIAAVLVLCALVLVLIVVFTVLSYLGRVALMRLVDRLEASGVPPAWRDGWRFGWSGRTFRLFVLELLVTLVLVPLALILLGIALSPLLTLAVMQDGVAVLPAVVVTLLLVLAITPVLLVMVVAYSLLRQLWSREVALANRGIAEALTGAMTLARDRLRDVGAMWLIMLVIGIGYGLASVLLLIPFGLLALVLGVSVGAFLYAATSLGLLALLAGGVVGITALVLPLLAVQAVYETFVSSTWTLTWREIAPGVRRREELLLA